jgi:hypothetical protein
MSQHEGVTETIEGKSYTMYMLPPMQSHNLLVDVVKMVGPALGPLMDTVFSEKSKSGEDVLEQELGSRFFERAAEKLFGGLDKAVFEKVVEAFKEVTHVDKKPLAPIFDAWFSGDLATMYKWLMFGMKAQWGKSLSALASGLPLQSAKAKLKEVSQSLNTSTG